MATQRPRLDDLLNAFRQGSPAGAAFVEEDGRAVTIGEFDEMVRRAGTWLGQKGIKPGDRVAVWLVNRIEWLVLLFAAARLGAVIVAVNTRYKSAELHHILMSSGARMLVLQPSFRAIDFPAIIEDLDPAELSELETVAVLGETGAGHERILDRPVVEFDLDAVEPAKALSGPDVTSDPDAPLIFFTTSGTTKAPKIVVHPQHTIALHGLRSANAFGFNEDNTSFLAAMPFCGVFGLSTVLAAIAGASVVHLIAMFEAEDAARRVEQHCITHLFGSDEMFRRLAGEGMEKLASARLCGFASFTPGLGPLLQSIAEKGLPLCGLYGSSEVGAIFSIQSLDLPLAERLKGGGRPASRDQAQVRARDPETGAILPAGETGDLEIQAPTNFTGYFRNAGATEKSIDPEGFFRTGDVGYVREDGAFVYVARSGDAIRLSGFLVDPAEIEDALKGIEGVDDAQVVGVETAEKNLPVAFVISDGTVDFDEARIIEAARAMLAAFKVPARIFQIDVFPTTESANGQKIQKAKLRGMAGERLRQG